MERTDATRLDKITAAHGGCSTYTTSQSPPVPAFIATVAIVTAVTTGGYTVHTELCACGTFHC